MSVPEEMSRDELIALVGRQAGQITAMAGQIAELSEAAAKHGLNMITVLGDAMRGRRWMPQLPAPT
ncbi:MAG: hypothetical protein ACRDRX_09875 [Pseudonocardiaceae bacterium]